MNPLLEQLRDIEGLDPVSFWPPAVGWVILFIFGALVSGLIVYFIVSKILFLRSWKNDTLRQLSALEKNLSEKTTEEIACQLSEYLRRIAIRRFPRKECAGLTGQAWLKWLATHDPARFDWENKGTPLIEASYAPPGKRPFPLSQMKDLLQAVKNWVR